MSETSSGHETEGVLLVVLDPNVLISAAITSGVARDVLDAATAGRYRIVACPRLIAELRAALGRDKFLRWRTREQLDRFVADIVLLADHHSDPTNITAWTRDPNDDYLVALTVYAGAD